MMYRVWAWLFFITAAIGTWAAYDHFVALEKLGLLTAGLVAVYLIDQIGGIDAERTLVLGGIGCAALAVMLGTVAVVARPSSELLVRPAVAAAVLVILLPLASGSVLWLWQRHFWLIAVITGLAIGGGLVLLIATDERSAW